MANKKYIIGDDGDREWLCRHGVGHGNHEHTCDGCCSPKPPCEWVDCPIRLGFEILFTGESDEDEARKLILPLIEKCLKHGLRVLPFAEKSNNPLNLEEVDKVMPPNVSRKTGKPIKGNSVCPAGCHKQPVKQRRNTRKRNRP